jgi:hypothetical protein
MKIKLLLFSLVSAAAFVLAAAADPSLPDPTGTWQWTNKGHRGQKMQTVLQLQLQEGQLSGTLIGGNGPVPISNATFKDEIVAFSVVDANGNAVKYSGSLAGDTIKGTVATPGQNGGDPVLHNWTAKRAPQAPPAPSS